MGRLARMQTLPFTLLKFTSNNGFQLFLDVLLAYLKVLKDRNAAAHFVDIVTYFNAVIHRVCTGPGKPVKSWNFVVAFSRTGMSWKNDSGPGKFGKLSNSSKKYEMYGRQQGELTLGSWE